jgi:A/G-specific adenine glycosylase
VVRVIARVIALHDDVRRPAVKKIIENISQDLIDPAQPGPYNESVMELGATICRPQKPDCAKCPVKTFCLAQKQGVQATIPFKSTGLKKQTRKQLVFAVRHEGRFLIVKRPPHGLLGSMWELPSVQINRLRLSHQDLKQELQNNYGISGKVLHISEPMKHTYSHFSLTYRPVIIEMDEGELRLNQHVDWRWQDKEELERMAVHRAHLKIFEWIRKLEIKSEG